MTVAAAHFCHAIHAGASTASSHLVGEILAFRGGEAPLHFFAHARSEEDARGAVEGLLESPVALRVAAEAGVDRGRQKAAAAAFDQLNEADQAQAGSVSDQRQADVPVKVAAHLARVAVDQTRQLAALQVGPSEQRAQRPHREGVMVGDPSAQPVCLAPEVAHVTLDRRRITAGHLNGTRRSQARQRAVIELQPCRAARRTGNTTGEHVLREGRGHADDVQVQVGRRIEENVILAGRPPEKVARRDRDGRFPVAERRVAGRDQVQLRLGVKMPRSPRRRDVMPDVASCGAGDRKRLVQRLRHLSRVPELARVRPGAWRGPVGFPRNAKSPRDAHTMLDRGAVG